MAQAHQDSERMTGSLDPFAGSGQPRPPTTPRRHRCSICCVRPPARHPREARILVARSRSPRAPGTLLRGTCASQRASTTAPAGSTWPARLSTGSVRALLIVDKRAMHELRPGVTSSGHATDAEAVAIRGGENVVAPSLNRTPATRATSSSGRARCQQSHGPSGCGRRAP